MPFDADELLHLGVHALERGDTEGALHHLKECLERDSDNAAACYLLAATYAEIRLYDRARSLFRRTLELAPGEHTASFQLGLLELLGGDSAAAAKTWESLDALDEQHHLRLFKSGLLALTAGDTDRGATLIDAGIGRNAVNPALNANMKTIRDAATADTAPPAGGEPPLTTAALDHVLSRYQHQRAD